MYAARGLGATTARVLKYMNSGDTAGNKSRAVGYGAAVFLRPIRSLEVKGGEAMKPQSTNSAEAADRAEGFSVSEKNQKLLLQLARQSIEQFLRTRTRPELKVSDPELTNEAAVFVTLTEGRQLRGCIGTTEPRAPLCEAVSQMAVAAAVEDRRFEPLSLDELGRTHIEISVLSPLKRVKSAEEIQPGVHGVVVRRGWRSGLFLPQVWEHFSKKEDFLDELCAQKAHLDPGAWREAQTELCVFTVFAFEEK
jgi:AmmeMemoRadiSam system protein A